jgi:IclR family transcriptional regulator, KDG regulon repressor
MMINQSLDHGLRVLLLYDTENPSFAVAEISRRLGFNQSKTYRLIRTLVRSGLVQEKPGTARYSLGMSALRMGLLAQQNFDLPALARPLMEKLSLQTKETVLLTAVYGTRGICLERVESEEPVRYSLFKPGATFPLHCGASSKVLMAHLPEGDWDQIIAREGLKQYTPHTITDPEELKAHLREIRKKGYAYSDQEIDRDVRAVAAPILNGRNNLVAGLSIAGPAYRIKQKQVGSLARLVLKYAEQISVSLGHISKAKKPKSR